MRSTDTRAAWLTVIVRELAWWRSYFSNGGLDNPASFHERLDPVAPLQPHLAAALPDRPPGATFRILDCAAGPATAIGRILGNHRIDVVAVDALADHYREMLVEIGLMPPVPSISCEVEHWTSSSRRNPSTSCTCVSPWTTATTRARPSGR